MIGAIKKALGFGDLVNECRAGGMSRRNFLQAAASLGVGAEEAVKELPKRAYSAPKIEIFKPSPWVTVWWGRTPAERQAFVHYVLLNSLYGKFGGP